MKAIILDATNSETFIIDGPSSFEFAENNYSCDCNRNPHGHADSCESKRFLVIAADFEDDEPRYSLAELNQDYPPELLAAHGIPSRL